LKKTKVDTYTAMVDRGQMAASAGDTTVQEAIVDNQAQVYAFQKIGGQLNRTICNVSLDTDYSAYNGLLFLEDTATIRATGDVASFQPAIIAHVSPPPVIIPPAPEKSSTNQVAPASVVPAPANISTNQMAHTSVGT
jgi:hypothetical protein